MGGTGLDFETWDSSTLNRFVILSEAQRSRRICVCFFLTVETTTLHPRSLSRPRLLIPRIHKPPPPSLRAQIRIVDRRPALVGAKPAHQLGIRLELRRPSIELPRMAQQHSRPPVHRLHNPPHLHIHIPILHQLADIVVILPQADDGEPASLIGSLRRAYVEVSSPVRQLHHVINMRRNTNVFIDQLGSLVSRDAWLRFRSHSSQRHSQTKQNDPMQPTQCHRNSFPGNGRMLARNKAIVKGVAHPNRANAS